LIVCFVNVSIVFIVVWGVFVLFLFGVSLCFLAN